MSREREINVEAAREMKAEGMSYREIGRMLATMAGRRMPFLADSVRRAIEREAGK